MSLAFDAELQQLLVGRELVGPYDGGPAPSNALVEGYTDWTRLPAVLRSCTALLTMSENETCPNVVLEALASGLPVLYKASGGTAELVGDCGVAQASLQATVEAWASLGR